MALFADIPLFALLAKALVACALALAGAWLLRSAHVDRVPRLAAAREASRKPYVSPHARPLPQQPVAPRLAAGADLGRLGTVVDRGHEQIQTIHHATLSASRQIDGAEMALNRLVADIARVMPTVIAPTVVPRRSLSLAPNMAAGLPDAQAA